MKTQPNSTSKKYSRIISFCIVLVFLTPLMTFAQKDSAKIVVPDWALPASKTHKQYPPPNDFHRATITENKAIGIFKGKSDVGAALVPGSSSYNAKTKEYTIKSAGYNIWYNRDEFHYLWKKMSGNFSLASDVKFIENAVGDCKVSLVIRQDLEDDAKEIMVTQHGVGNMHLVSRKEKGLMIKKVAPILKKAKRIGIEKRGDVYTMYMSMDGEPMVQVGDTMHLNLKEPFYVGIGVCSHQPIDYTTAVFTNVVLKNKADNVK